MTPPVLVIRHEPHEGLGLIEEALKARGLAVEFVDAWQDAIPKEPTFHSAIVLMGGSMGVYEADRYPFLKEEIQLLQKTLCSGVPVLGVCLGSQLLAAAARARVYPGPTKEIGWYLVKTAGAARQDDVFKAYPRELTAFHWHGDTFDLPPEAELLASSAAYQNQAFRIGVNAWGVQFHPEITEEMIRDWVRHGLQTGGVASDEAEKMLSSMPSYLAGSLDVGKKLFERFSEKCGDSAF